ncbi:MAG TPA: hypothetical protein VMV16_00850 [Solirubrobacteraceae bacterium]|nr:hypothetical protein [Solirubrobacteraceae bacterium]
MRHSVRACLLLTVVCAMCVLALPATASASKGSPVHVDPGSPVAKEYALPLATARGAPPESGRSGGLFGSGIKHTGSGSTSSHTTTSSETPPVQTETTPPVTTTAAQTTTSPKHHQPRHIITVTLPDLVTTPGTSTTTTAHSVPAAYKVLKPGSGSGLLWMVLAAVVVVALGAAGGLALARRR